MSSSGFRPFTDPFLRFLQLKATADDIQFRREQQELRREQMRQDIAQQQRQNQVQDFNTKLALRALGGHPVFAGNAGKLQAGLGGREAIETPVGQYSLPSESQQFERAKTKAKQAGELAGIEQTTKEAITEPFVDVDLGGQIGTVPVPKKDVGRVKIEAYTKTHPNLTKESYGPDRDNNYTVIFRDPNTKEEVRREIVNAGPPKTTESGEDGGLSARAYSALKAAQEAIDKANAPEVNDIRDDRQRWQAAQNAVDQAIAAFPNELIGGKGGGGFPFIRPKGPEEKTGRRETSVRQPTANTASSSAPSVKLKGARIKVADLDAALKAFNKDNKLNYTSEQFSKWLHSNGVEIVR